MSRSGLTRNQFIVWRSAMGGSLDSGGLNGEFAYDAFPDRDDPKVLNVAGELLLELRGFTDVGITGGSQLGVEVWALSDVAGKIGPLKRLWRGRAIIGDRRLEQADILMTAQRGISDFQATNYWHEVAVWKSVQPMPNAGDNEAEDCGNGCGAWIAGDQQQASLFLPTLGYPYLVAYITDPGVGNPVNATLLVRAVDPMVALVGMYLPPKPNDYRAPVGASAETVAAGAAELWEFLSDFHREVAAGPSDEAPHPVNSVYLRGAAVTSETFVDPLKVKWNGAASLTNWDDELGPGDYIESPPGMGQISTVGIYNPSGSNGTLTHGTSFVIRGFHHT